MSKEIIHCHELHIVFEEDEDHVVYWNVERDDVIKQVKEFDTAHLKTHGAPLAAALFRGTCLRANALKFIFYLHVETSMSADNKMLPFESLGLFAER